MLTAALLLMTFPVEDAYVATASQVMDAFKKNAVLAGERYYDRDFLLTGVVLKAIPEKGVIAFETNEFPLFVTMKDAKGIKDYKPGKKLIVLCTCVKAESVNPISDDVAFPTLPPSKKKAEPPKIGHLYPFAMKDGTIRSD